MVWRFQHVSERKHYVSSRMQYQEGVFRDVPKLERFQTSPRNFEVVDGSKAIPDRKEKNGKPIIPHKSCRRLVSKKNWALSNFFGMSGFFLTLQGPLHHPARMYLLLYIFLCVCTHQPQTICTTFYKFYTNVLCFLGMWLSLQNKICFHKMYLPASCSW